MSNIPKTLVSVLPADLQQEFRPSPHKPGCKIYGDFEAENKIPSKGKGKTLDLLQVKEALQGSSLDAFTFDQVVERYHLVEENTILPAPSYIPYRFWKREGVEYVAVYVAHLDCGLRFPLHPFIQEVLEHYQLGIAQLTPPSYRLLCGFLMICQLGHILPSISLFKEMFKFSMSKGVHYILCFREGREHIFRGKAPYPRH